MTRSVGKEGNGGSTRPGPKREKKGIRMEECVVKTEWSEWFGCSRLAIVAFSLFHCHSAGCLLNMVKCAENPLALKKCTKPSTVRSIFGTLLSFAWTVRTMEEYVVNECEIGME